MNNPLITAVDASEHLMFAEGEMMFAVAGDAAFKPFNESLSNAIVELLDTSVNAVSELSPRARQARLNLIWRDFVAEQRKMQGGGSVPKIEF